MNTVIEAIEEIQEELSFAANTYRDRDGLLRRLNKHYLTAAEQLPLLFLQTEVLLPMYAPVTGSSTASRAIVCDAANLRALIPNSTTWINPGWAGQAVYVDSDDNEYRIDRVDTANIRIYISSELPAAINIGADASYDFTIKFDRYMLPADCVEPLKFINRTTTGAKGELPFISRPQEENVVLDVTDSGDPLFVVEQDHLRARAPEIPLTLGQDAVDGSLPGGRTYQYAYTIVHEGRESVLGPTTNINLAVSNTRVSINTSLIEDVRWDQDVAAKNSGGLRHIYRRDLTKKTAWVRIHQILSDETGTIYDKTYLPADASSWEEAVYYSNPGPRQTVRGWQVPDEDLDISLRYHRRPRRLVGDSDVIEGPPAFDAYLVNLVVADILKGSEAEKFTARAARNLTQLERSMDRSTHRLSMRSIKADMASGNDRPDWWRRNLGVPSRS